MPEFEEAPDLQKIAQQLIATLENVDHIDLEEVLFLRELQTKPKALAKCYKFGDNPVGYFTDKKYCIVFYWACCDYMTPAQLAILVLHELMHIPSDDKKLIDHDIQDFRAILLDLGIDWAEPGAKVPDIIRKRNVRRQRKSDISPDKGRRKADRGTDGPAEQTADGGGCLQAGQG